MIARISGRLEQLTEAKAVIDTGSGLWYEVLVPACDVERLRGKLGQEVVLHTIHYVDGDPSRGGQTPRLIGFCCEEDRRFLQIFTTVKGIGIRKALRALAKPISQVAAAIVAKDEQYLATLPEIGKRTAQQIVAELHDKVDDFAACNRPVGGEPERLSEAATEALHVLIQLGEKRVDATALVERVLAVAPETDSPEEIIRHAFKLKAGAR
ncbi:MAG: Holliday junction DNA helicase RuvA [Planctomycetes bacterium]|nr:Holliday junction DNA helicase RuvA [Planctomycetota bacterium]